VRQRKHNHPEGHVMASETSVVETRTAATASPLSPDELRRMNAWWHACNYLAVGMIYLQGNPLLRDPLTIEHVKRRLLGHWGQARPWPSSGPT
jgi:xylulose-5-phosphate/fructose-6-phosphate phosphoketolase